MEHHCEAKLENFCPVEVPYLYRGSFTVGWSRRLRFHTETLTEEGSPARSYQ